MSKVDYYKTLGLTKTASQQEIKQSYKQLALKHHPDKNQDKETSKIIFTEITEAYSVLNDPKKRKSYDQYGVTDNEFAQYGQFQEFMNDFGLFEEFLEDFLAFDELSQMEKMFSKMMKGGGKKKKGGRKKRGKGPSMSQMDNFLQQMLAQTMKDMADAGDFDDLDDDDDEELTEEELLLLEFGQINIEKKKIKKKKKIYCKIDGQKIEEDQILIHFSDKHAKQFQEWKTTKNGKSESLEALKSQTKEEETAKQQKKENLKQEDVKKSEGK